MHLKLLSFLRTRKGILLDLITVNSLIGTRYKLRDCFTYCLKKNALSIGDGFIIRKHIINALYNHYFSKKVCHVEFHTC